MKTEKEVVINQKHIIIYYIKYIDTLLWHIKLYTNTNYYFLIY